MNTETLLLPVLRADFSLARKADFARLLLDWYAAHRRDLPWRKTRDPYAIWISEMMLQQTQVATVIPYWNRWMERFPTVAALASASLEDVLKQWQGLGYYARARNLHRAARVIQEQHQGVFPTNFAEVLALPGIGRYTAGAICSIALGLDVPIVDANVIRVLCRVFGLQGDPKSPSVQEQLWTLAKELIPLGEASAFNQGMMELGALICHSSPRCPSCPVQSLCYAFSTGVPEALPEFAPKPEFTRQTDVSAIVYHPQFSGQILLFRRPEGGLWGGLWELPRATQTNEETVQQTAERAVRETTGLPIMATDITLGTVRHGVTTRKITLVGVLCRLREASLTLSPVVPGSECRWVPLVDAGALPLSSPQAQLLVQIQQAQSQPSLFGD